MKSKNFLLLLTLCGSLSLAGCGKAGAPSTITDKVKNTSVKQEPMSSDKDVNNAFTEEGLKLIKDTEGLKEKDNISTGYWGIGTEMPDIDAKTYSGKKINLAATKGKNTVVEYVAYWCSFCQEEEREDIKKILDDNPDITYIQVFADGSKKYKQKDTDGNTTTSDVIQKFYQDSGEESVPKKRIIVQENSKIVQFAGNDLHISRFPSFYFYDSSGKASWYHEGVLSETKFNKIKKVAFGKDESKKLYNNLKPEYAKASDGYRGWPEIMKETPNTQQDKIKKLSLKENSGLAAYYGNLYRPVDVDTKMVDLNNKVVKPTDKGKTVYGFFELGDKNIEKEIQVWNQYTKVTDCSRAIAVLISSASVSYNDLKTKPSSYAIDATDIPDDIDNLRILGTPELVYVNDSKKKSMGGYYGDFTLEDLQKAEKAIINFNPGK